MADRRIGQWAAGASVLFGLGVAATGAPPPIDSIRVANGLSSPLYVTHAPGDFERVFIVEQCGRIRILKNGAVLPGQYLNISTKLTCSGEQGLLGLAFHPDYQSNGAFFVNYTNLSGTTTIARYTVTANPEVADIASEVILLSIAQPFSNHNGGWISFGPDGYLYIGTGDGGSGNDPGNRGQDITAQLLGKMLRIDVDGADNIPGNDDDDGDVDNPPSTGGYTNPATNPFVGVTGDDEIWAYGLRNPWRNSFDRLTGDLYIADVGQNAAEEIDFQPASDTGGRNYGWRCMEGTACTGLSGCTCNGPTLTLPIHTYNHSANNCSVTGGYNYRGCGIAGMDGTYFFADYCSNTIWSFKYDGVTKTEFTNRTTELVPNIGSITSITSFGEDAYGEIYICDQNGEVFKIIPVDAQTDCNNNLRADRCDIAAGSSLDVNLDGIPDECIVSPPDPMAETGGANKSRTVSTFIPAAATAGGVTTALQITLTSLHHPNPPYLVGSAADFSAFEDQVRWVGPPTTYVESSATPTPFVAARTQCTPFYHDWSTVGLVHVIGREIVPSSVYGVRQFAASCQGNESGCTAVSNSLELSTTRWGDIDSPFNPPSASVQPDFADIAAIVNKFKDVSGAPAKVRVALAGDVPDLVPDISFVHIAACVDAFKGLGFPYSGPMICP